MNRIILLLVLFAFCLAGCMNEDHEIKLENTGVVVDNAGAGDCGIIIELEAGGMIQPFFYPEGFTFSHGQRVYIGYFELPNIVPSCNKGVPVEIVAIEELNCTPYVVLNSKNYDSLASDPVFIHEAFIDGNCLQVKLSYSGGCKKHTIDLALATSANGNFDTVPVFEIRHNANGDMCEAYFTKEFRFDLTPLKITGVKEIILKASLTDGNTYNEKFRIN